MRPRYLTVAAIVIVSAVAFTWLRSARRPAPPPWAYGGCDLANTRYYPRPSPVRLDRLGYRIIRSGGFFDMDEMIDPHEDMRIVAADIAAKGSLDLTVLPVWRQAEVLDQRGLLGRRFQAAPERILEGLTDWNDDGVFETIVSDSLKRHFTVLDRKGRALGLVSLEFPMDSWAQIFPVRFHNRGVKKWIACEDLNPRYASSPAGFRVVCYDLQGALRWQTPSGPNVWVQAVADLDGDGCMEIICGTISQERGAHGGGLTDRGHGYVFALDENGIMKWMVAFSGRGVDVGRNGVPNHFQESSERRNMNIRASVADLDRDGKTEVVACGSSWRMDWGKLAIIRGSDGTVLAQYPREGCLPYSLTTVAIADLYGDGRREVISGCTDGYVRVFDSRASLMQEIPVSSSSTDWSSLVSYVWGVNDLDGDGSLEVLVSSTREKLISDDPRFGIAKFLDNYLSVLGYDRKSKRFANKLKIPLNERCRNAIIADLIRGGPNEIAALTDQITVYALTPGK